MTRIQTLDNIIIQAMDDGMALTVVDTITIYQIHTYDSTD